MARTIEVGGGKGVARSPRHFGVLGMHVWTTMAFTKPPCDVFTGPSGHAVVVGLTLLAFVVYCGGYWLRRRVWTTKDGAPLESRPLTVFLLDLSKLGLGQGSAWAINLANSHRNARFTATYDPLSWYFPTFLADELFAVPLGVALGKLVCCAARRAHARYGVAALDRVAHFGRYSPEAGDADEPHPPVYYSWWATQLVVWVGCVMVSRSVGGLVLPAVELVLGHRSPFHGIARAIYALRWSCAAKRLFFAGLLRILIDVLQIAVVDFFNKFRKRHVQTGAVLMETY